MCWVFRRGYTPSAVKAGSTTRSTPRKPTQYGGGRGRRGETRRRKLRYSRACSARCCWKSTGKKKALKARALLHGSLPGSTSFAEEASEQSSSRLQLARPHSELKQQHFADGRRLPRMHRVLRARSPRRLWRTPRQREQWRHLWRTTWLEGNPTVLSCMLQPQGNNTMRQRLLQAVVFPVVQPQGFMSGLREWPGSHQLQRLARCYPQCPLHDRRPLLKPSGSKHPRPVSPSAAAGRGPLKRGQSGRTPLRHQCAWNRSPPCHRRGAIRGGATRQLRAPVRDAAAA